MKISVEFAHTSLTAIDPFDIARSVTCAKAVVEHLEENGHEVTTVTLFDDKRTPLSEAETLASGLIEQLSAILPPKQQQRLQRDSVDYMNKFGSLPCSVDIALWHTKRLGLLGKSDLPASNVVVSILGDGNREPEELARHRFLDFIPAASGRIVTLYYPESPDTPANINELIEQIDSSLLEVTNA